MGNRGFSHDPSGTAADDNDVDVKSDEADDHELSVKLGSGTDDERTVKNDDNDKEPSEPAIFNVDQDSNVLKTRPDVFPCDSMSVSSSPPQNIIDSEYGPCCLTVILSSTHCKEKEEKMLSLPGYPVTGIALKNQIQAKFNIPVCVQTLFFSSQVIKDNTLLNSLYLQHGDVIEVEYIMNADIEYFSDLVGTLLRIKELLCDIVADLLSGAPITYAMHQRLQVDCGAFTNDCVPLRYFSVFPTGSPNANQLYFLNLGGLSLLIDIYKALHELPWHMLPHELQSLEYSCLQVIWNFSATLGIRQMIVEQGVMDLVFKTMNRAKIVPNEHLQLPEPLADKFLPPQHSLNTLAESVYASLVVTGNFAEMPQCRLPIASSAEVVDALLAAMLSPTYTYTCARSGMCAMLCLSFSPCTHKYIKQEETMAKVLEIYDRTCVVSDGTSDKETAINQTLVGFYSLLFFCNLLHHWTAGLALPLQSQLTSFMLQFIKTTTHREVLQRMQEKRYYWSTFIPFLSLCYCPALHHVAGEHPVVPKPLLELTVKAGVLSMKCMCLSENAMEVIEYEGLKDFITCVSWNNSSISCDVKCLLSEVTQVAHQNLRFQPPSLCNIVKAFLASHCCGLEGVLEMDTHSLVLYVIRMTSSLSSSS